MKANLLRNKVAVVTGGDSEFSQKLALELALAKTEVILIGKNKENLEKPAKELQNVKKKSGNITPLVSNWNSNSDIEKFIASMKRVAGSFDILFFNYCNSYTGKFEDLTNSDIDKIIDKELKNTIIFLRLLIKEMRSAKKPAIVTLSDFTESVGVPYFSMTNLTSFALKGFFESLRREFIGDKFKFMDVKLPISKDAYSDDCKEKLTKLGFADHKLEAEIKVIIDSFNNEKPFVSLDKKGSSLIFSNNFNNRNTDKKFKVIKTKLLNAVSSND